MQLDARDALGSFPSVSQYGRSGEGEGLVAMKLRTFTPARFRHTKGARSQFPASCAFKLP